MIATCHICKQTKECPRSMVHNGVRIDRCGQCDYGRIIAMSTAQALNQADAARTAKSRTRGGASSGSTKRFKHAMGGK